MLKKKIHLKEAVDLYKELKTSEKVAEVLCNKYGIIRKEHHSRLIRYWMQSEGLNEKSKEEDASEIFKKAKERKHNLNSKFYIISAAQNATPINKNLLINMEAYAKHLDASIEIIPFRYKNPTSVFTDIKQEWWETSIEKYLIANRHSLNKNITVLADVKIQPTASEPLSGLEGLTGIESSIIGHPRQHMYPVPTLEKYPIKVMFSTGCITLNNNTDSKVGAKADFHHTYGFVIVEIKNDNTFFIRHVSAQNNGNFYDLDFKVENGVVTKDNNSIEAVVFGDLHLGEHCEVSLKSSYEMLERFKPKTLILHDLIEGRSISHHERSNPFKIMEREEDGSFSIEREIEEATTFLTSVIKYNPVVVAANHNDFLDRWLIEVDWRKEKNKYTYLKYAKLKSDGELPLGILAYEIGLKFGNKVKCLREDDSFIVKGVELGQHGHIGSGGSRGSANQFKKLNTKMVTGHTHTPLKKDGLTTVGTLTKLRMGYNKGLSSWANSNALVFKNGKTQNLIIIDGEYTML